MNLEALTEALRFRFETIGVKSRIHPGMFDTWINRGIERIATDTLYLEGEATLTPDGTNSSFTVIGSGADNVASDFLAIKSCYHSEGVIEEIQMDKIEELAVDGDIIAGNPTGYVIFGGKIYFNNIPGATLTVNFKYYKVPSTLSAKTDEPDYPLSLFGRLVLDAAMLEYANDIDNESLYGKRLAMYKDNRTDFTKVSERKSKLSRRSTTAHTL